MTGEAHDSRIERRFVVLRHEDREGLHFDLMIESGERLATWKFPTAPESVSAGAAAASSLHWPPVLHGRRIGDHRRAYLTYEGPVSGDRGHVTRHDEGTCRVDRPVAYDREPAELSDSVERWCIEFCGRLLRGRFELVRDDDQGSGWSLCCLEA